MRSKLAVLLLFLLLAAAAADCLTEKPPKVSLLPTVAEGGPDYPKDFTINVTSQNPCDFAPGDCGDVFSLVNYTPEGWNATFSRNDVRSVCGQSNSSAYISVTPKNPYVKIGHSYEVKVEAYDMSNPLLAGNGSATYTIPSCSGLRCCGDRVCDTGGYPPENRTNCPTDCCSLKRNGVCEFYDQCAGYDPDCCYAGDCLEGSAFGCDQIKNEYAYCRLTTCGGGPSGCLSSDSNCYGYQECGSGFCYNTTGGTGAGPLCGERCAPNSAYPPIVNSFDAQSCCECWDEPSKQCLACNSTATCLSLTSDGYAIYSGDGVAIKYEINASACPAGKTLNLYAGGPLRKFVSFPDGDRMFRIQTGLYEFSAVLSGVPSYVPPGLYQLKVGAVIDNANQGADVAEIIVTPSVVFEEGGSVPPGATTGYVNRIMPMSYRDDVVPVRLEVWVW